MAPRGEPGQVYGLRLHPVAPAEHHTWRLLSYRGHRPLPPLPAGDVRRVDRPVPGDRSAAHRPAHRSGEPRLPLLAARAAAARRRARASWPAASTAPRVRPTPRAVSAPSCVELARDGGGSLDVVEIDAASHNGVDDARDLRERAAFAPARDRYKIFILDEAHMVTPQGFNALLKLVEEPPEHVKFIFATTEPEKVIGTIRSRTHHYPFRLVPPAQMLDYVQQLLRRREGRGRGRRAAARRARRRRLGARHALPARPAHRRVRRASTIDYERAVALLGYTHGALLDEVVDAIAARDAGAVFARGRPGHPDRARSAPVRRRPARAAARPHRRRGDPRRRGGRAARRSRSTRSIGCRRRPARSVPPSSPGPPMS